MSKEPPTRRCPLQLRWGNCGSPHSQSNKLVGISKMLTWSSLQDSASCGGHSSSGSTSSLSTPPSLSQSPPRPPPPPPQLNGVAGLMGVLGAGVGSMVGSLNGVIQTPVGVGGGTGSPHAHGMGGAAAVSNRYDPGTTALVFPPFFLLLSPSNQATLTSLGCNRLPSVTPPPLSSPPPTLVLAHWM